MGNFPSPALLLLPLHSSYSSIADIYSVMRKLGKDDQVWSEAE